MDRSELEAELPVLEATVQRALDTLDESELRILGYGEISLVLGWPREGPEYACKRLPMFPDRASFDSYRAVVERYLDLLDEAGVRVVESHLHALPRADGRFVGYLVQPVLPADRLGPALLRSADPNRGHPLVGAIFERVLRVASPTIAIDEQLSNWAWIDEDAIQIDVSTPFLRDDHGRHELDFGLFAAALPWLLRWPVKRFVVGGVLGNFHEPRTAFLDFLGNLHKERLAAWLPYCIEEANRRLDRPITRAEVDKAYALDKRIWATLLWFRRVDRLWQRRIRRRQYPFLLPPRIER